MKLGGGQAAAFLSKPDQRKSGALLYGADGMRVALKRKQLISALVGEKAEEEIRLARMSGAEVRKEPARVLDALKAQGFFPGPRVVYIEDASDGIAAVLKSALAEWSAGDATLVVSAGALNARSKLRKLFESDRSAVSIGIYNDPPGRREIENLLNGAKVSDVSQPAMDILVALAQELGPGELQQTIQKLGLYKYGDDTPVSPDDIQDCAPATTEAELDDAIHIIAEGRSADVVPTLRRLEGQGVNPTTLCISATRHFRTLHSASCHTGGPDSALARARPPVFGPRKDRMVRQVRGWGTANLEKAIVLLLDTDLALRSSRPVPAMAMVERAFIRISMMRPK